MTSFLCFDTDNVCISNISFSPHHFLFAVSCCRSRTVEGPQQTFTVFFSLILKRSFSVFILCESAEFNADESDVCKVKKCKGFFFKYIFKSFNRIVVFVLFTSSFLFLCKNKSFVRSFRVAPYIRQSGAWVQSLEFEFVLVFKTLNDRKL